jgi:phenylalanyl-tRNA synthetase beta chain
MYKGAPIPSGKKSVAFSLRFRSEEKSLTDEDITPVMGTVLKKLESDLGAVIR